MIKTKLTVYSNKGESAGHVEIPDFAEPIRRDLISRLYRSTTLSKRQPYGSKRTAGMRNVGHNSGANHGIARLPRVAGGKRGVILASMVGGKSAHAPVVTKNLKLSINDKERMIARRSAIMLTFSREDVVKRGHAISPEIALPIVVKDSVQEISKSSEALDLLTKLGLSDDIQRAKDGKKIRAGRGKMRGRRYKEKKSILIVGTDTRKLGAFASLPGVDIASVGSLGISKLAPGGKPGRLTVYTESALNQVLEVFK